jgi:hypothetical protein
VIGLAISSRSFRKERVQRRVGDVLDLQVVEVTSHQVGLEFQRSEPERGDRPEVTALEVRPCPCCIDWGDVEKQVQAALDLGEAGVDIQNWRKLLGRGCHLTEIPTSRYQQPSRCTSATPIVARVGRPARYPHSIAR